MTDVTVYYGTPIDSIAAFLGIFKHNKWPIMSELYCVSTKLSQIVYLINVYILLCQHFNVAAGYRRFSDSNAFFGNFHVYYYMFETL